MDELLESVGLLNVKNARVSNFSGGMKRRLSVAISSIGNPRIIFLDEPTTGMDPVSRRDVWNLI
jgi:ABC-type multidrug transport system ATPase subunit